MKTLNLSIFSKPYIWLLLVAVYVLPSCKNTNRSQEADLANNGYITQEDYIIEDDFNAAPELKEYYIGNEKPNSIKLNGTNYDQNTEEYSKIIENTYKDAKKNPLSTFSIDVDAASYSNVRRFLQAGQMPRKDAVRIEELVNYFDYDYPQPKGEEPFSIYTEMANCPWNPKHKLVHIGLQGKKIDIANMPAGNLVFLIDVSGSMDEPNKLPLVKKSLRLLVEQMREKDKIGIVVYSGAAGVVLKSTSGDKKDKIYEAIENLSAGGATAGGEGIIAAYNMAKENFIKDGNNRVILATDGDFNIGIYNENELTDLIEKKRNEGIYLSVLGYGMGNYKDSKLELLADKGNGNYAYIDNLLEAKKVLVNEAGATLFTIAKDVKIQVEFNPKHVKAYRLVGYENRLLKDEDFDDDTKDAGELGAGHTVTALYEIVPVGVEVDLPKTDDLKYQDNQPSFAANSNEVMTVKFRYKKPDEDKSNLLAQSIELNTKTFETASENFKFSASVAMWGMLLRGSQYIKSGDYAQVLAYAKSSKGTDENGYRAEFLRLVELSELLAKDAKNMTVQP